MKIVKSLMDNGQKLVEILLSKASGYRGNLMVIWIFS